MKNNDFIGLGFMKSILNIRTCSNWQVIVIESYESNCN